MAAPAALIVLASASPRRRALLEACRIEFRVMESGASEDVDEEEVGRGIEEVVSILAARKAEAVAHRLRSEAGIPPDLAQAWVLGADTVVEVDGLLLGKPADQAEARDMLERLSGRTHHVHTGIALKPGPSAEIGVRAVATAVTFRRLMPRDLDWYLATREWEGAAGAYRIQERAGLLVESIRGSYSNVVGLPLEAFYGMLMRYHYDLGGT